MGPTGHFTDVTGYLIHQVFGTFTGYLLQNSLMGQKCVDNG
jgi:hypothetical protein